MTFHRILSAQGLILIALGIAFGLYAPLMLAFFGIPENFSGDVLAYWNVASFARLFGVTLLGQGLLIWAIRQINRQLNTQRGIAFSLLLFNLMAFIVTITQQFSIWTNYAGWLLSAFFAIFSLAYLYVLIKAE